MVTQNPFQSRRIDFREQTAKSRVMTLDGDKIMQITAVNIACLWHRWQHSYNSSVFLVSAFWICICCL